MKLKLLFSLCLAIAGFSCAMDNTILNNAIDNQGLNENNDSQILAAEKQFLNLLCQFICTKDVKYELDAVQILQDKKMNPSAPMLCYKPQIYTPIMYSVRMKARRVFNYLIDQKVDINVEAGTTVLEQVLMDWDDEAFAKLLTLNPNVHRKTKGGANPLYFADIKNIKSIRYLCEKGVDVNNQDEHGNTYLHKVTARATAYLPPMRQPIYTLDEIVSVLKVLRAYRADPSLTNKYHKTARDVAYHYQWPFYIPESIMSLIS